MNKKELTVLYNELTYKIWQIEDEYDKIDNYDLAKFLDKVQQALSDYIDSKED